MFELAQGLAERSHEVVVVTTTPRYNLADGGKRSKARFISRVDEDGITVIRVSTVPFHNVGPVARGVGQLILPLSITAGGMLSGSVDVTLVYSPPLTMAVAALFLKRCKGAPYVLNVQDLFPQSAIDLGVLQSWSLIRFFEAMESWVYKHAAVITVHSKGNAQHLRARTRDLPRIEVVDNWIDVAAHRASMGFLQ